jgi:hypothetical protein
MISRYSVKKPFTVLVGVLLVIVLGVVSLGRMTTAAGYELSVCTYRDNRYGSKSTGGGEQCHRAA